MDIFGILVIVNMNLINRMMLVSIWVINKCRKTLVNKLAEECNEIIEEVKIVGENKNKVVLACFTWFYFQYSLQAALELVFVLLTINT